MGEIKVGTASWTDRTLLDSGWYPDSADTPERRLSYYARQFPLVEVDATYYSPPAERTARLWAERTPAGFTFNVKAFSLLTGHPTRVSALYKDLRPDTDKRNVYPDDLPAQAYEEVWTRFLSALDPLVDAGKLGALLFQFPPWFTIKRDNKQYLLEVARRCAPLRPVFEFRHASWFDGDNAEETLGFLREHALPFVCVDMPQGHKSSVPPVLAATADLAMVRFHGHSDKWTSKDIHEKFGYDYSKRELRDWAPKLRELAGEAEQTHVLMNNCYRDYAQRNATTLADLLDA
ncbi:MULTISPECIES: DUF72 domain-containing protein [Micromonospora]|uniref:DUF72 domain-containing protein n=1 Tax=Micromonospora TaxID=1873 RepID=UPI0003EEB656|nr:MULTISPECIES: DUF72 domain-containing protein [unclassified Micromonospora]EWM63946.1 hypothetical protein MCBG_01079 [Micromonospora sp. M42]MCK1806607.1 DUF72 domain-containing protein [Micromonospora sp. R42106]MCK1833828.1 DUF72 domain-containing protein [Micromonospora sp. R42003]MCK1842737.1 DUF72 domain-containing protein [Micromonospora sp. R42004]MCM1019828.1 DUF72 domain-containing protein [Micromonospora sp. XM-20-01]